MNKIFSWSLVVVIFAMVSCTATQSKKTLTDGEADKVMSKTAYTKAVNTYSYIDVFSEGLARVEKDGRVGYIDADANEVIICQYVAGGNFSEGMARVENKDGKVGFVNKKGELTIPYKYDDASDFHEGYAIIFSGTKGWSWQEGSYGFVNNQGQEVVPCLYDDALPFKEGMAGVKKDNYWGFINTKGVVVVPFSYEKVESFSEGLACVLNKEGMYGYLNKQGEAAIPFVYDMATSFSESLAWVHKNDAFMCIDLKGEYVFRASADISLVGDYHCGMARICSKGKFGYMNKQGEVVIQCLFDDASDFQDNQAEIKLKDDFYVINTKGEQVK